MRSLLCLVAFLPGVVAQTPSLNTSEVSIKAAHSGSGCPLGALSTTLSPDRTTITLGYDPIHLFLGPQATRLDATKNCQVQIQIKYPSGWNFTINGTRWHGHFTLNEGVRAQFYTKFELRSRDTQVINVPTATLNGTAAVADQLFDAELPVLDEQSSICLPYGDAIVVYHRWSLSATRADAYQEEEWMAEGLPLIQQLQLRWQKC